MQRAAHERVEEDWRYARVAWCDAHGYLFLDLIRAENAEAAEFDSTRRQRDGAAKLKLV